MHARSNQARTKVKMEDGGGSTARRQPSLSIKASRAPSGDWPPADEGPVSPTGRLMDGFYIVVSMGLGVPLNFPVLRAGIETQLARHPRFRSIQVTKDGKPPRWVRASALNLDDHIISPLLDGAAVTSDPDKAVEDYVASLSTAPMDRSRPLWELHFLNFPTSEATSTVVIRVHHSLGDGMSLLTLLMASTRSAADPSRLPAMPALPARSGAIYARPRPPWSAGALAFVTWAWSYVVLAWHTVVDVALFVATIMLVRDPQTLFKPADGDGGELPRRKRFVHRSLSLDDAKLLKHAMNCTVNDVIIGVTSAALSRYYFRKSGDNNTKIICLRSILLVNMRPTSSLQEYVDMMVSGKSHDVTRRNQLGYIILPFQIAVHKDPLEYVRMAKKTVDRKKSSLEVMFTHMLAEVVIKTLGVKALTVHYQSYSNIIRVILAVDEAHFPDHGQLLDDFTESLRIIKDEASRV